MTETMTKQRINSFKTQTGMINRVIIEAYEHFQEAENYDRRRSYRWIAYIITGIVAFIYYSNYDGNLLARILVLVIAAAAIYGIYTVFHRLGVKSREEAEAGQAIIVKNGELLQQLPHEYLMPCATGYIAKMVSQERAESIKEALMMCDEYLHRMSVEQNQEKTNKKLDEIHEDMMFK